MPDAEPASPSYLKYAFKDQHNLVLLFGAACFSAAFASPLPVAVGAAGELLWLSVGPRLPAFRGWVDRQISEQYLARAERAIEGALGELTASDVERFSKLTRQVEELVEAARAQLGARELQLGLHGLLELRRTVLDYLFLGQRIEALLDPSPATELEQEAAQLQEAYAAERELTARMTIRKALSSLQKRMTQQTAIAGVKRNVELRLEMLDEIVPVLRARLADPAFAKLAPELDTALAEVGPAETLELALDEIFTSAP